MFDATHLRGREYEAAAAGARFLQAGDSTLVLSLLLSTSWLSKQLSLFYFILTVILHVIKPINQFNQAQVVTAVSCQQGEC